MRMRLLLILFFFGFIWYQGCDTTETAPVETDAEVIRNIVLQQMALFDVPGVQVCVLNPAAGASIIIAEGVTDKTNGTKVTEATQFFIGSNTKSFTAHLVLMLLQQGLIALDDSIGKYVDFGSDTLNRVSIRSLMNMHAGLRGYLNDDVNYRDSIMLAVYENPASNFTPAALVEYAQVLNSELGLLPDTLFHYSNTNYVMLGMLIEQVSGKSYEQYVEEHIINPLGLQQTFMPVGGNHSGNVSKGYLIDKGSGSEAEISGNDMSYVWSAGGMISTADEICRWMQAVAAQTLLNSSSARWLYEGFDTGSGGIYTAGLLNEPEKLWHSGTVLGFHSEMCFLKNSGIFITVLTNCNVTGVEDDPVRNIIDSLVVRYK
jgi:CubicO group peptidase (beta-lactamase class C family)